MANWQSDKRKRAEYTEKDPRKRAKAEDLNSEGGSNSEIDQSRRRIREAPNEDERGISRAPTPPAKVHPDRQHYSGNTHPPVNTPTNLDRLLGPRSRSPDSLFVSDETWEERKEPVSCVSSDVAGDRHRQDILQRQPDLRIDPSRSPVISARPNLVSGVSKMPESSKFARNGKWDSYRPPPSHQRSEPGKAFPNPKSEKQVPKTPCFKDDPTTQPSLKPDLLSDITDFGGAVVKTALLKMESILLEKTRASEEQNSLKYGRHKSTFVALKEQLDSQTDEMDRAQSLLQAKFERNCISEREVFLKLAKGLQKSPSTQPPIDSTPGSDARVNKDLTELREATERMRQELEQDRLSRKNLDDIMHRELDARDKIIRQQMEACVKKELRPKEDEIRMLNIDRDRLQEHNNVLSTQVKALSDIKQRMSSMDQDLDKRVRIKAYNEDYEKIVQDVASQAAEIRNLQKQHVKHCVIQDEIAERCRDNLASQQADVGSLRTQLDVQNEHLSRLRLPADQSEHEGKDLAFHLKYLLDRIETNSQALRQSTATPVMTSTSTISAGHDPIVVPDLDSKIELIVEASIAVLSKKHEEDQDNIAEEVEKIQNELRIVQNRLSSQNTAPARDQPPTPPYASTVQSPNMPNQQREMTSNQLSNRLKALEVTVVAREQQFNQLTTNELVNKMATFMLHRYPPQPALVSQTLGSLSQAQFMYRTELDKYTTRLHEAEKLLELKSNTQDVEALVRSLTDNQQNLGLAIANGKYEMTKKAGQDVVSSIQGRINAISGKLSELQNVARDLDVRVRQVTEGQRNFENAKRGEKHEMDLKANQVDMSSLKVEVKSMAGELQILKETTQKDAEISERYHRVIPAPKDHSPGQKAFTNGQTKTTGIDNVPASGPEAPTSPELPATASMNLKRQQQALSDEDQDIRQRHPRRKLKRMNVSRGGG